MQNTQNINTIILVFAGLLCTGLISGCSTTYQSPPDAKYWVKQGLVWKGVKSGNGEQVRTRDIICRDQKCILIDWPWPANAVMRKYDLTNLQYPSLEKIAIAKNSAGLIRLPNDLGAEVYLRLHREQLKEERKERMQLGR